MPGCALALAAAQSGLGIGAGFFYRGAVIGFLRFVGLLNAAVWLGAAVFFTVAAEPAASSQDMKELLGPKNYPYFSVAIAQVIANRYYYLQFACGLVALLHVLAAWLYLGRSPRRHWLGLLIGLILLSLISGGWLQPKLRELNTVQHTRPAQREAAGRAFRTWHSASQMFNWILVGGLAAYLWRVANPPDPTRFVSTTKFRS